MQVTKWLGVSVLMVLFAKAGIAQQLKLGGNPSVIEKSAVLDLNSDNQGLLFPRIADTVSVNALTPPDGMVIYFTPSKQLMVRSNGGWQALTPTTSLSNYWSVEGNSSGAVKKLGTVDNYALPFVTNNTERMRISNTGNVGIGTTSPSQKLDVNGTIVSSSTSYPNYGYNAANRMAFGESNVPANETGSVVQYGSGSNTRNMLFAFTKTNVNTSFFGNDGTQMMLGSESTAPITFRTGLSYTAANIMASGTERMRITASGVGIGTTSPTQALDITGNLKFSGALMPGGSAGTAGQFLRSAGAGAAPTWTTLSLSNMSDVSIASPVNGQLLQYNGSVWSNVTPSYLSSVDTTNIANFSTKVRSLFSAGSGITYNAATGTISAPGATNNWSFNGNTVTTEKTFGTVDNFALPFITNNTERMRLTNAGRLGIGTTAPNNLLEVTGTNTTTGVSGLRLTDLGTATVGAATSKVLSVNSNGDVIVTNNPATSNWLITGNTGINSASNFLGNIDDKAMIFKSNNQSYMEFGRRQTLGLYQNYTDYNNNDEKVTYIRSALQFEAPGADFYKPKMYTDANGNFRIKGSSAGTDYFEFGSTGINNNGGFEFIIGDDGDEPILFKSYHYLNGMSEIMRLQSGRMAVGSNAFDATNPEKLLIDAGVTNSYNLMTGKGSIDNYLQINVQNRSAGGSASSDLVATSNNGNESINYVDLGINGGGYTNNSYPVIGGANNAYLYSTGNDFSIGNGTASKALRFFTGGFALGNERMRIDGSGRVGIGNTSPSQALDVTGNIELSGALMPGGAAGTAGYILSSNGAGAAPSWISPASLSSSSSWALGGNNVSSLQTLGTTSNYDLPFITNNTEQMRLSAEGNLAIGASTFDTDAPEKLLIDAGTTTSYNLIYGKGRVNNYLQFNIQNESNGNMASSDIVATSNSGTETSKFIDMGINSSGFSNSGILGGPNNAYLYSTGNDLIIGNATAGSSLRFFTGGTATSNEHMRMAANGNVGIATTTPQAALDVNGTYKLGASGTVLSGMIKTNVSITDNTTFAYTTTKTVTATVTGAAVNGTVIVNPRTALPASIGIAWARVSGANTITIAFTNTDTALKSIGTVTFDVTVIQ